MPLGTIRVEPTGADPRTVNGLGDLQLNLSYDLHRHWGRRGRLPSLQLKPLLALPSGKSSRVIEEDAPPNLISIGNGTVSIGGAVQLLQPIAPRWGLRVAGRWLRPLGHNDDDLRFGAVSELGVSVMHRPVDGLLVGLGATGTHRTHTQERQAGTVINSGGQWLFADLLVGWAASERMTVGASVRAPLYRDVNGEQIVQSIGVSTFVSLSFGEGKKEEEHDHGKEEHDSADMRDLATGGKSFTIADAAVPGKVVAVDFWATWCTPCKEIEKLLHSHAKGNAGFAVRKVEVPSFDTEVAVEHLAGARGLPIVWLVDRNGKVVERLESVTPDELRRKLQVHASKP